MCNQIDAPATSADTAVPAPAPYAAIVEMFDRAAQRLKYPKVRLGMLEKHKTRVVLSRAGSRARYPGSINITTDHRSFEQRTWFGRINRDGTLHTSNSMCPEVCNILAKFNANPQQYALLYGQEYNQCMFCGLTLTNEVSVAIGYGPVCADNFGLPHSRSLLGDTTSEFATTANEAEIRHALKDLQF